MKPIRILTVVLFAVLLCGCIRHKVVITSDPPEAMVTWNEIYRGRTPIEVPFTYHWKYTVDVERKGYKPASDVANLRTRPWFYAPMGFICEALPIRFTDTRNRHYTLEPAEDFGDSL